MPELSRFHGIRDFVAFRDHPPPHFHAVFGEFQVSVRVADGRVEGRFPARKLRLLLEWYDLHRAELAQAWNRASKGLPPSRIEPLE